LSTINIRKGESSISPRPHYWFMERYHHAYIRQFEYFFKAIKEDRGVAVTGTDGLKTVIIAEAAKKSSRLKRPAAVDYGII